MKPRNIPILLNGGFTTYDAWRKTPYFDWFNNLYSQDARILSGNPLNKDLSNWRIGGPTHHQVDDLAARSYSNYYYTSNNNKNNITSDILNVANLKGASMTPELFRDYYNLQIRKMHEFLNRAHAYTGLNNAEVADFNNTFNLFYKSRGIDTSPGGILFNDKNKGIYGTLTLQRDVDMYQTGFDQLTGSDRDNRIHKINLNGKDVYYAKTDSGELLLLPNNVTTRGISIEHSTPNRTVVTGEVPADGGKTYGFDWSKIRGAAQRIFSNPDIYAFGRLAGNLANNERVYDEQLKGINPDLKQSYHTYRQVVGDEATKLAYYRRAVLGQTKAARPFTSDADRLVAYMMEAKRIGDEQRALGDLADNQEIRRTSDESNLHQWANTLRDTEVANANLAAINLTNALKHNLLALKHSAQWSSIDNFLQGIEYRKRLQIAEDQALNDLIFALEESQRVLDDPEILSATLKLEAAIKKNTNTKTGEINYRAQEVLDALRELNSVKIHKTIDSYRRKQLNRRNLITFVKEGTKITHKKKDDLLYKSAKDVVEHFRKMSKLSSDALNRKKPKIEKLAAHPKAKKYQLGGVAPFTIYKPVALGGETSTSAASSGSKKSKGDDTLDMIKELFKSLVGKGLPSDVNSLYISMLNFLGRARAFGEELSTDDIASMYLLLMQRLNLIQYLKSKHDSANLLMILNDAVNEIAVDFAGRLVGQNKDGEIIFLNSIKDAKEKGIIPLTNGLLLKLRATDPALAGHLELDEIAANGIGMTKIAAFLKAQLPSIGSSEQTIEGYTKKDSNTIRAGLELLAEAPNGDYKYTRYNKELLNQAKMALNYLKGILPNNMKRIIETRAEFGNLTVDLLLGSLISSGMNEKTSLEFDAITGKAVKNANGGSNEKGDSNNSAGLAFVLGQGPRETLTFNTGTSMQVSALGIRGTLLTHSNENLGLGATLQDATKTQQGGYFEWSKATFGGSRLNSNAFNHIILNDSTVMGVDLPYTTNINGNEIPDFLLLRRMEEADLEIKLKNIKPDDYDSINQIYLAHQLSPKFDQNGKLNTQRYKRFAVIQATLDEASLADKDSILADEVTLANDVERDLYELAMKGETKTKDYSLSNGFIGLWRDNLYKGSIFIPYKEDIAFAAVSSGKALKVDIPNSSGMVQQMQYAPATLTYKSPEATLSQIKND